MLLQFRGTNGIPPEVLSALINEEFAYAFLNGIADHTLDARDAVKRAAEYHVSADIMPLVNVGGYYGICVYLSGVSRSGRTAVILREALGELLDMVEEKIRSGARSAGFSDHIGLWGVMELDGDAETSAGVYSRLIESEARLI